MLINVRISAQPNPELRPPLRSDTYTDICEEDQLDRTNLSSRMPMKQLISEGHFDLPSTCAKVSFNTGVDQYSACVESVFRAV